MCHLGLIDVSQQLVPVWYKQNQDNSNARAFLRGNTGSSCENHPLWN